MSKNAWQVYALWAYFACAIVFVYGSWRVNDPVFLSGSILFLFAAVFALLAHYSADEGSGE